MPPKQGPESTTTTIPRPPKRKRRRFDDPPIFARRAVRTKGRIPIIPNPLPPVPKHMRDSPQNPWLVREQSLSVPDPMAMATPPPAKTKATPAAPSASAAPAAPAAPVASAVPSPVDGPPAASRPADSAPAPAAAPAAAGSLGPWEPSITGYIPYEEITKTVCDFLFRHVVLRNDAVAAPAGSAAVAQGAIIEVEAKLGQLIDMDRRERLQLPLLSESVLHKEGSRFRTSFESTMTVVSQSSFNIVCLPPPPPE